MIRRSPMSMTREEAIAELESIKQCQVDTRKEIEALDLAISALHPVSREQVEKVWRGEWESNDPRDIVVYCKQCMMPQDIDTNFCHSCGAAMTNEAVEMVMEKINNMKEMTNEY